MFLDFQLIKIIKIFKIIKISKIIKIINIIQIINIIKIIQYDQRICESTFDLFLKPLYRSRKKIGITFGKFGLGKQFWHRSREIQSRNKCLGMEKFSLKKVLALVSLKNFGLSQEFQSHLSAGLNENSLTICKPMIDTILTAL